MTDTISRSDSLELAAHVRRQERNAKSLASLRGRELMADFEEQLAREYAWDEEATWVAAKRATDDVVAKANAAILDRCRELGIPKRYAPSLQHYWSPRGENGTASRRAELRKVAKARIEALEASAKVEIERRSIKAQTELLSGRLSSEAAQAFLAAMPTAADLMPKLQLADVHQQLGTEADEVVPFLMSDPGSPWGNHQIYAVSGKTVTTFTISTSETADGAERTEYHAIVAWDRLAEIAGHHFGRRQLVAVEGRLQTRSWDDEHGHRHWKTEVVAERVEMLSGRGKGAFRGTADVVGDGVRVDG